MATVGSILHGAYGDYYEQLVSLKQYKRKRPGTRLALFFASPKRLEELRVFDMSFADAIHLASELDGVHVDEFVQYQIRDGELQRDIISKLPVRISSKFDFTKNLKPWTVMRELDYRDPTSDIGLSDLGRERLPGCMRDNDIDPALFRERLTVGFLWRHRATGPDAAVSAFLQEPEERVLATKSELLQTLVRDHDAHVLICGMNLTVTDENRTRVDAKFTEKKLQLDPTRSTYLQGLSWGLELETLRRCSFCVVMPSGFSEALWMKGAPVCLVDAPPHYVAKLVWNRMPLFDVLRSPRELAFQLRRPHDAARVIDRLTQRGLLRERASDSAT